MAEDKNGNDGGNDNNDIADVHMTCVLGCALVRMHLANGLPGSELRPCVTVDVGGTTYNMVFSHIDAHRLVQQVIGMLAAMGSPEAVEFERIIQRMVRRKLRH